MTIEYNAFLAHFDRSIGLCGTCVCMCHNVFFPTRVYEHGCFTRSLSFVLRSYVVCICHLYTGTLYTVRVVAISYQYFFLFNISSLSFIVMFRFFAVIILLLLLIFMTYSIYDFFSSYFSSFCLVRFVGSNSNKWKQIDSSLSRLSTQPWTLERHKIITTTTSAAAVVIESIV